jgi:hypothetical protein
MGRIPLPCPIPCPCPLPIPIPCPLPCPILIPILILIAIFASRSGAALCPFGLVHPRTRKRRHPRGVPPLSSIHRKPYCCSQDTCPPMESVCVVSASYASVLMPAMVPWPSDCTSAQPRGRGVETPSTLYAAQ